MTTTKTKTAADDIKSTSTEFGLVNSPGANAMMMSEDHQKQNPSSSLSLSLSNDVDEVLRQDQQDQPEDPQQRHQRHHHNNNDGQLNVSLRQGLDWMVLHFHWIRGTCCHFHRSEQLRSRRIDYVGCLQIYVPRFVLEVCGAAGSVWGCSEIFGLRTDENTDQVWRPTSTMVFLVYLVRFYWHSKHYLERERDYPPIKAHHRRIHILPFVQIFGTKLLLQVFGAAGAMWGSSAILQLRKNTPESTELWTTLCVSIFLLFFLRWTILVLNYCLCFTSPVWETMQNSRSILRIVEWTEVLFVNFVLDVLGGAGAVYGVSEIFLLRTDETLGIWRSLAIAVGVAFAMRWIYQFCAFAFPSVTLAVDNKPSDHGDLQVQDPISEINIEKDNNSSSVVVGVELTDINDLSLTETNEQLS